MRAAVDRPAAHGVNPNDPVPSAPADDPQSELAALVAATLAHQRRRRALGVRAERGGARAIEPASAPGGSATGAATTPAPQATAPRTAPRTAPSAPQPAAASAVPRTAAPPPPRAPAAAPTPLPPRTPPPRVVSTPLAAPVSAASASAATDAPARSVEDVRRIAAACADVPSLRAAVARCEACSLATTRTQTVFADGPERADVLFIGEAPGEHEDRQGVPFVGESGRLLTDIIEKGMGLPRSRVLIANVLKCRPPENRDPSAEETRACTPWLDRQIALAAPKVLIPLGKHASNHVLGLAGAELRSLGSLRERVHERGALKIVPTFHPSYLLRTPEAKKDCWKDIQLAMGLLGLVPKRTS
jgi:uracil-DNA glycosylase family 4